MEKQRLVWADSLKGWLMLLVIIGHAVQCVLRADCDSNHLWNLIYAFHMPAFMAISGWLAFRGIKEIRLLSTIKRRAQQLLIPYFIWSIIEFSLSGPYTIEQGLKMIVSPDSYFWFLWVLFWINVIFVSAQWVAEKMHTNELLCIGACCVLLMGLMVGLEIRIVGFQFIAYYFLFYTLGYCIHRFCILQLKNKVLLIGTTFVWAILAWYWNMHSLPTWMPAIPHVPSTLLQYAYRGLTALLAIEVIMSMSPRWLNGTGGWNTWMKDFGTISLGIYVIHLFLLGHIAKFAKMITTCDTWVIVLTCIVVTVAAYWIAKLLQKNTVTSKYLLGKNS